MTPVHRVVHSASVLSLQIDGLSKTSKLYSRSTHLTGKNSRISQRERKKRRKKIILYSFFIYQWGKNPPCDDPSRSIDPRYSNLPTLHLSRSASYLRVQPISSMIIIHKQTPGKTHTLEQIPRATALPSIGGPLVKQRTTKSAMLARLKHGCNQKWVWWTQRREQD